MSSLLKTYCFVAIQCLSSSTTRTVSAKSPSSLRPVLTADMAETEAHGRTNSCRFQRSWERGQTRTAKHAMGRGGVETRTSGSGWAEVDSEPIRGESVVWVTPPQGCQNSMNPSLRSLFLPFIYFTVLQFTTHLKHKSSKTWILLGSYKHLKFIYPLLFNLWERFASAYGSIPNSHFLPPVENRKWPSCQLFVAVS